MKKIQTPFCWFGNRKRSGQGHGPLSSTNKILNGIQTSAAHQASYPVMLSSKSDVLFFRTQAADWLMGVLIENVMIRCFGIPWASEKAARWKHVCLQCTIMTSACMVNAGGRICQPDNRKSPPSPIGIPTLHISTQCHKLHDVLERHPNIRVQIGEYATENG